MIRLRPFSLLALSALTGACSSSSSPPGANAGGGPAVTGGTASHTTVQPSGNGGMAQSTGTGGETSRPGTGGATASGGTTGTNTSSNASVGGATQPAGGGTTSSGTAPREVGGAVSSGGTSGSVSSPLGGSTTMGSSARTLTSAGNESAGGNQASGGSPGAGGNGSGGIPASTGGATAAMGGGGANAGGNGSSGGTQSIGGSNSNGTQARYPFPQNVKYPYGVQSSKVTNEFVKSWYDHWSKTYLQQCNSNMRPGVDPLTKSLVEAQGFAMVAAAYMGDKPVFDKLYNYYKAKCTTSGCGLMGWKQTCDGFEDQGAATDGDIDVASSLVVASWQWPGAGYDEKANAVITTLKSMVTTCSGKSTVYPGCSNGKAWGGCNETDISYYSPAFFRYFAKISGDSSWTKLADDTHTIRDAAAHASTGLVPDWQSVSGTAGAGSRKGYYSFDAIRTPYKHALDYLWNGNEKSLAWCQKITTWAYGVGVKNIKDEYALDGTARGSNHNMAVIGSLAVAAMANSSDVLDAFVQETIKLKDDYWYSGYLGLLYLLALSGNMWNPDLVSP